MVLFNKELICEIQVTLSSICFGLSFVGQRIAAIHDEADPMTYNSWRFIISVISLYILRRKLKEYIKTDISETNNFEQTEIPIFNYLRSCSKYLSINEQTFHLFFWGILGGILNFGVQTCQQYGLQTVSAGKAALINGLFVVVAPFIESILPYFESNINLTSWCAIIISGIGTYFLSDPKDGGFGFGEFLLVLSMLGCCFGILISDVASKRTDCIDVTLIELATIVILSTCFSLWNNIEYWYWPLPALQHGIAMVLCVGVSEAIGYSLGTLGQMHIPSHRASVLYGLEGAFATFFGFIFLGEILSFKELIGCGLIIAGTILGGTSTNEHEHEHIEDVSVEHSEIVPLYNKDNHLPETRRKENSLEQKNYGSTV